MGKLRIQFKILFKTRIRFIVRGGGTTTFFKKSNIYIQAASPLEIRKKNVCWHGEDAICSYCTHTSVHRLDSTAEQLGTPTHANIWPPLLRRGTFMPSLSATLTLPL